MATINEIKEQLNNTINNLSVILPKMEAYSDIWDYLTDDGKTRMKAILRQRISDAISALNDMDTNTNELTNTMYK